MASNLHNLGDVLVVKPQNFLITLLHELVVKCELDGFTLLQLNLSGATLNQTRTERVNSHILAGNLNTIICAINQTGLPLSLCDFAGTHALDKSGPDFWSLGVQSDGHWSVVHRSWSKALSGSADVLDGLSMVLYGAE